MAQLAAGQQALGVADSKYSGTNVASTPVFSTLADYSAWLVGRGTSTNVNNDVVADPSLLGLQDGALTLALARQNPNPVNVLRALQNVVLAGGVLSETFKQSVADQLGTNTANVNVWVASGGAAITSFLVAMDNPTALNVSSAALSLINAGITITPSLQQTFADKLGVTSAQFGNMLAYGGAGLAVVSALKNPTPQNIVASTQQVTAMLGKMQGSASLQDLSYTLGTATTVFSVYNFVKNPSKQSAVSVALNIGMKVAPEFAVPLAAALTIGELVVPGFTDKAVNALVHDIPGVAFDTAKQIIKVEASIAKGTINLAGSVVDVVGGAITSAGDVVSSAGNLVGSGLSTTGNIVNKVFGGWCPIVLNLADDPVHTTTLTNKSPLFDLSGDGIKERAGWITADEGFLVRDLNGNGKIDNIKEMFSDRTSATANTAFGALTELDSNKDGVIDKNDAAWGTLKIWVDKNSDGESQANELYTLAQLGIASIKLNPTKNFAYDNGNVIGDKSTFTYTDGRKGEIADAIFTTQDASVTQTVSQTLITDDSTTVRLSNGQTMKVFDVHGKSFVVGSVTEGINIVTSTGNNTLTAADDANGVVLMGETGDTLNAGKGHLVTLVSNGGATLVGNAEDNLYVVSQTTDAIVEAANAGIDTVRSSASYTLGSNLENLMLIGSAAINGTGNALNNTITGNSGANVLDGGVGADTLVGGAGNDTYVFARGSGQDIINENDSTAGNIDTVQFDANVNSSNVALARVGNDLWLTVSGGGSDQVQVTNWFSGSAYQVEQIKFADGTLWNTATISSKATTSDVTGDASTAVSLAVGAAYIESIATAGDHDWFRLSLTAGVAYQFDQIKLNGSSIDSYLRLRDTSGNQLAYNDDSGGNLNSLFTYTPTSTGTYYLDAGGYNNTSTGNYMLSVVHREQGTSGADSLSGTAGADQFEGGSGDDVYTVNHVGDVVIEGSNAGVDKVNASVSYTLGANVENLTLTGTAAINGTGNALNNTITGNAANNVLDGGAGVDTLQGGLGDDTYVVDTTTDVIVENANEGTDTVQSSVSYALGSNLENLTLTGATAINGTGNALNNTITGNAANNVLDGGAGVDTLQGGLGDDTYTVDEVGDVVTENLNEGTDTVRSSVSYALGSNLENLTLTGTAAINGTGNALNNTITGNAANNVLDGGAGVDTLQGGLGDDTYVVDTTTDVIIENLNEGTDTVQSSVSYALGSNLENITLTGATAINSTGNALNNTCLLYTSDAADD